MALRIFRPILLSKTQKQRSFSKRRQRPSVLVTVAASQVDNLDEERVSKLISNLSESLKLPSSFLKTVPKDLQVDVRDAAFALSKGPVIQECGVQAGNLLLKLGLALEQADSEATREVGNGLPSIQSSLDSTTGPALGRRLINAGKYLKSTGQYGEGEFQRIAIALSDLGEAIGGKQAPPDFLSDSSKVLKFGTLQVEVTSQQSFLGAAIAFVFSILSWQLAIAVQNSPDSSLNYANDNALLLASSLRGTLLAMGYTCAGLSAFSVLGLVLLGFRLSVKNDRENI